MAFTSVGFPFVFIVAFGQGVRSILNGKGEQVEESGLASAKTGHFRNSAASYNHYTNSFFNFSAFIQSDLEFYLML